MNAITANVKNNVTELIDSLSDALPALLIEKPHGWTEFELIKALSAPPYRLFTDNCLRNSLSLFQTHFLLFHALYKLRRDLLAEHLGSLEISAQRIRLSEPVFLKSGNSVAQVDPLEVYYSDLNNFLQANSESVEKLLNGFWQRYHHQVTDEIEIKKALMILQLDAQKSPSLMEIKRQYRKLVMKHHPDRGGAPEKIKAINAAMAILREHHWHLDKAAK